MANKNVVQGKVEKKDKKNFKVKADKTTEVDADIEIVDDGDYVVEKLNIDDLPDTMPDGKTKIKWFNYFSIKIGNDYIRQPFKVTIPGLGNAKNIVILDRSNNGRPYYFSGTKTGDTIQLNDGDPGIGQT